MNILDIQKTEKWLELDDLPGESWKDIPGWEGFYQASTLGRIKSISRLNSRGERIKTKIRKQENDRRGYPQIILCRNGKSKNYKTHQLIAAAFLPNPKNKLQVNHLNGIKNDNCIENLEWNTNLENMRHSWETGIKTSINFSGEKNGESKLKNEDVIRIRELWKTGEYTKRAISKMFPVTESTIGRILNGQYWKRLVT